VNKTVFSNGLWNVLGGMSSAIVAILVPPFLTRALPPEAYGAWAVALQIGTYVNIFGMGIQVAVGRYVAFHHGSGGLRERDGIVASAFWCVLLAALAGVLAIGVMADHTDQLFPQLPQAWQADAAMATGLLGLSFGVGLIGSVFGSVFLGLQKNHVPAIAQLGGRVAQAGLLIVAVRTHSLTAMAVAHLLGSIGTSSILAWLWKSRTWKPTIAISWVSRSSLKELGGFCLSLTVWNLAMLLVSGLDLLIVTRYEFGAVPFYAVSLTLVSFIAGTLQALAAVLTPAAASMQASGSQAQLRELFVRATGLMSIAGLLVSAPLIFAGRDILNLWVGFVYADNAYQLLALLAGATVIRTCLLPYGMIAIGTGQQRRMIYTPLAEGAVSLGLSIWWARDYGAIGVAYAKVVSAAIGIFLLIIQHALLRTIPKLTRTEVTKVGVIRPTLFWLALGCVMAFFWPWRDNLLIFLPLAALSIGLAGVLMGWRDVVRVLRRLQVRKDARA
jgi:O-antigen/teichoic acid export membrane protein